MNARALALSALAEWRRSGRFADAIIHSLLDRSDLALADRGFANELFHGVLRNLTLLDFWISGLRSGALEDDARDLLRLGLYQIVMLATPAHAAVFETVALAPKRTRGLINGVLRSADRQLAELRARAAEQPLYLRSSHPEFLVRKWEAEFGHSATEKLCAWNNQPAPIYARINELKVTVENFLRANEDASLVPDHPSFTRVTNPGAAVASGACYIQDPSTTVACDLLAPEVGETILDACAAPGGKTSYLAQLMRNTGAITACDRAPERVDLLADNLERLGVTNTRVLQHDWRKGNFPNEMRFDRILVDAPCSNTGVMRRRVDVRWRLQADDFTRMPNEQLEILSQVIPLLQPGGVLVYSTCSLEREENDAIVQRAITEFPILWLEQSKTVLPFRDQFDGAFAARLRAR